MRAAGGLAILGEVQSGFGRTGDHYWAFEADGVVSHIAMTPKGVGNGIPLGAALKARLLDLQKRLSGQPNAVQLSD